jgi:hypothetical protein
MEIALGSVSTYITQTIRCGARFRSVKQVTQRTDSSRIPSLAQTVSDKVPSCQLVGGLHDSVNSISATSSCLSHTQLSSLPWPKPTVFVFLAEICES